MSANRELEMHAGDDFKIDVTVKDDDGVIVDISAATIILFGISLIKRGVALLTKDLTNGITITNGPNGQLRITLAAVDTADLLPRTYFHELKIDIGGERDTVLVGNFVLKDSILK